MVIRTLFLCLETLGGIAQVAEVMFCMQKVHCLASPGRPGAELVPISGAILGSLNADNTDLD